MKKIILPEKEIAGEFLKNKTQLELAKEYNTSTRTIGRILKRNLSEEEYQKTVRQNILNRAKKRKNIPRSEEVKKKISATKKGVKQPWVSERQRGEKNHMYGRTGEKHHNYGKKHTEEARKKMSDKLKGRVAWNKGLTGIYSQEQKEKMRQRCKQRIGELAPNWKGGITKTRGRSEYSEWRKEVFKRDKHTCQICGQIGGDLEAHHIRRISRHKDWAYDLCNGITLCKKCHREIRKGYGTKITMNGENIQKDGNYISFDTTDLFQILTMFEAYDNGKAFRVTIEEVD